jgi:cell wall-associated NlpC family hydrolase
MHRRHLGAVLLPLFAIFLIGALAPGIAHAETAAQKRAEAKRIKTQIDSLDMRLEMAVEQYNFANAKLGELRQRIAGNQAKLETATDNLRLSRENLAARAEAIYKQHSVDILDVIFSSESFDEMVSSLDMMRRLNENDSDIVDTVERLKKEIATHRAELLKDEKKSEQIVAQKAAIKTDVESQLASRQEMLQGVEKQIKKLERQERLARIAAAQAAAAARTAYSAPSSTGSGGGAATTAGAHPEVATYARQFLGVPYVWGGASPSGFDCSGLAMYCYQHAAGIGLYHNAQMQYNSVQHIATGSLVAGDLVFFGSSSSSIHHVGIYIGGGQMIHAPHTGAVVSYESIYYSDFYGGGRP